MAKPPLSSLVSGYVPEVTLPDHRAGGLADLSHLLLGDVVHRAAGE
jgi:hypothetical protein